MATTDDFENSAHRTVPAPGGGGLGRGNPAVSSPEATAFPPPDLPPLEGGELVDAGGRGYARSLFPTGLELRRYGAEAGEGAPKGRMREVAMECGTMIWLLYYCERGSSWDLSRA